MKKFLAALAVGMLILPSVFGAPAKTEFTVVNGAEPGSLDPAHIKKLACQPVTTPSFFVIFAHSIIR